MQPLFRSRWPFWIGCFWLWGMVSPLWSQTAVFVQGAAKGCYPDSSYQTEITYILGNPEPTAPLTGMDSGNFGGSSLIEPGCFEASRSRGLLRFPLSSLKGQVTHLRHARLTLSLHMPYTSNRSPSHLPAAVNFELYRLRPENAAWSEGSSTYGEPQSGAVSWAWLINAATPWTGSKGCGVAGTDYDASPVSSATLAQSAWLEGQQVIFEIDQPDFLQGWITQPQSNAGFLLRSSTQEALPADVFFLMRFHSDEAVNPLLRPRLEIDYDALPGEPLAQAAFQAGVTARVPDVAYDSQATSLFGGNDGSYGSASRLCAGFEPAAGVSQPWRALLRFDLSRLRDQAHTVRWLRLTLTVESVEGAGPAGNPLAGFHMLQLHRISPANAAWREGRSADGAAEAGAATWGWLAHGSAAWAGGAAAGAGLAQPDADYAAQPLATRLLVPAELREGDQVSFDFANPGCLYQWIEQPETNAGFRLSAPSLESAGQLAPGALGKINFYSDDAAVPAKRPRLDVFYATSAPRTAAAPAWRLAE